MLYFHDLVNKILLGYLTKLFCIEEKMACTHQTLRISTLALF